MDMIRQLQNITVLRIYPTRTNGYMYRSTFGPGFQRRSDLSNNITKASTQIQSEKLPSKLGDAEIWGDGLVHADLMWGRSVATHSRAWGWHAFDVGIVFRSAVKMELYKTHLGGPLAMILSTSLCDRRCRGAGDHFVRVSLVFCSQHDVCEADLPRGFWVTGDPNSTM